MSTKLLEIGDIILKSQYGSVSFVGKIDRVTEKTAFIDDSKYKREIQISSRGVVPIPRPFYSGYHFLANEDDILELKKQNIISYVVNFDYKTLSFDKLCEIRDIIKKP